MRSTERGCSRAAARRPAATGWGGQSATYRFRVIGLALVLILLASLCGAQTPGAPQLGEEISTPPLPALSDREATGEAVVDLADFVCGVLEDSGLMPDYAQVQTADGSLRRLSAAEVFALLARTAYLWDSSGELPELVPIAPEDVGPPQLDSEDVPEGEFDAESGREIPTDQFLARCGETVRWLDRLNAIPTAVWVNGERLSAAEYLAGLAICIQYAYWQEDLEDTVFLPAYIPPQTWLRGVAASAVTEAGTEVGEAEGVVGYAIGGEGEEGAGAEEVAPFGLEEAEAAFESPMLTLLPEDGARVSGKVDLLAVYSGPPAGYVIFAIDTSTRAITNYEPYSYRWDASGAAAGPHTVRVRVFDEDGYLLIDQVGSLTVVASAAEKAPPGDTTAPSVARAATKGPQQALPAAARSSTRTNRKP